MTLAQGIDVSKWQATTPALAGLSFLIARASIGTTVDPMYATHIANARKAGLVVGAYHYNWTGDPRVQARYFLTMAGDVDLYAIDVEGATRFSDDAARAFIDECHLAGKRCGLYASLSGYPDVGQDWRWIAYWSSTDKAPTLPWDFWQYGGTGVDRDAFRGTEAELRAWIGEDMIDPVRHLPLATATIAPGGTVYADPDRKATLIASWSGGAGVGLYARPANPTATPVPLVPIRITTAGVLRVGWVGWDKVKLTDTSAADKLAGARAEWDRQSGGAKVTLLPRP